MSQQRQKSTETQNPPTPPSTTRGLGPLIVHESIKAPDPQPGGSAPRTADCAVSKFKHHHHHQLAIAGTPRDGRVRHRQPVGALLRFPFRGAFCCCCCFVVGCFLFCSPAYHRRWMNAYRGRGHQHTTKHRQRTVPLRRRVLCC